MKAIKYIILLLLISSPSLLAQSVEGNVDNLPVHEYTLTIKEEMVNKVVFSGLSSFIQKPKPFNMTTITVLVMVVGFR